MGDSGCASGDVDAWCAGAFDEAYGGGEFVTQGLGECRIIDGAAEVVEDRLGGASQVVNVGAGVD